MVCAGLDLSTRHLDYVTIDTDNPSAYEHRRIDLPTPWWDAARTMMDTMLTGHAPDGQSMDHLSVRSWLHHNGVQLLGVERPYGPHRQAIAALHTILGAVIASIPAHITVLEIRPAEMRAELGLKATAPKEAMHDEIRRRLGHHPFTLADHGDAVQSQPWPGDALDAWAVAWAAWKICDRAAETTR